MFNKATAAALFVSFLALIILSLEVAFSSDTPKQDEHTTSLAPFERVQQISIGQKLIQIQNSSYRSPNSATEEHKKLIEKATQDKSWQIKAYSHLTLYTMALYRDDKIEANKQRMLMLEYVPEQDKANFEMALLLEQAIKLARMSENEKGIQIIAKAIALGEKHGADMQLLRAYNTAGVLHNSANQLNQSQWYFYQGIELGKRYPGNPYSSKLYNNMAQLYVHLEQWQSAINHMNIALDLYLTSDKIDSITMQTILLNLSYSYQMKGDKPKAKDAYQRSQKYVSGEIGEYPYLLEYKARARILWLESRNEDALEAVNKCLSHPKADFYAKQKGQCLLVRANIEAEQGKYVQSLATIKESLNMFDQVKHSRMLLKTYLLQAENFEKLGRLDEALEVYKQFYQREKEQLSVQVYALEHSFELREVEQERDLLDVQNQLNALQLERGQLRLKIATIWILLVLFALGFALHRAFAVKSRNLQLEHLSNVDPLTGLNNRRYYHQELKQARQIDLKAYYRLVLIDIDYFKSINDTYGHDVGDQVLVETAARISEELQPEELFVRWGGEEFLCLIKDNDELRDRIKGLLLIVNQMPYETDNGEIKVTVSIGVGDSCSPDELRHNTDYFAETDHRLYEAKRQGRNRSVFG
ncbi:tetratricopeptide repeat-containing diguanylate cyclase [Vibrio sonorensis]|uniref:tetratricopeptide repeat-containing diguanylate cyclase n=1 Tax=Vibrio sonorensis TaxID=1004316 RepID=UPI0008DAD9E8|nr:diguanylate cyclase [Vibrio sonorensis]